MAKQKGSKQIFVWEGKAKGGSAIKGEKEGLNAAMVKAELRRQGIIVTKIKKQSTSFFNKTKVKIKPAEIAAFTRQLSTMTVSGIPLVQAFEIVGRGHDNPGMQNLILAIKNDLESGLPLAESFGKHPLYFNELFCNLINAGEQSGSLEAMLDRLATYREKAESLKGKIKAAMFYPIAVLVVAFIITAGIMIFVVPQFRELFQSFGADLPAPTLVIMAMSDFLVKFWWVVAGFFVAAFHAFKYLYKTSEKFVHSLQRLQLKLPVLGDIMHKAAIARYARTLETTFAAGLPLVDALEAVAGATGNIVYSTAALQIRDEVSTGQQIQLAMRNTGVFPNMVIQMIAIGEESGSLETMLGKVADIYEGHVDNAVDALSSLLEPIIMVVLGILVGGIVIAMYLPIFKLGSIV